MRKLVFFLASYFLVLSSTLVHAQFSAEQDEIIMAAYDRAKDIIDSYPPEKFFVLNLGMTTTPFSAALRAMIPDPVHQDLYFRDLPLEEFSSSGRFFNSSKQFEQLIRRMIPEWVLASGRQVVVVRVLQMGATMQYFMKDLTDEKLEERLGVRFHFHLFKRDGDEIMESVLHREHDNVRFVRDPSIIKLMNFGEDRGDESALAHFGKFKAVNTDIFRLKGDAVLVENSEAKKLDMRLRELLKLPKAKVYMIPDLAKRLSLLQCARAWAG